MQQVTVSSIEVPKKWRPVKKAVVSQLAESFGREGQLQPIGLRPHPDKPGVSLLVWGRHRLEAAKKLGWPLIDARVMDLSRPADAEMATIAENLFRHPLSAGEKVVALKAWHEHYAAENPVSKPGGFRVPGQPAEGGEKTPSFPEAAAAATGIPAGTIKRMVAAGSKLSDEQLGVLAEDPAVTLKDIKAINKLETARRSEAVSLIASGLSPRESIATATLPSNTTRESVGDPDDGCVPTEADMTDEDWLETYCGEVLAQLKYQAAFKRDALLYRHSRDARQKLRGASKKLLAQTHAQVVGPFYLLYAKFVNIDHPSRWMKCGPCGGTGMSGDKGKCPNCHGHAYAVKTAGGGR